MDITEFIAARLAEDEAEANPAVCGCLDANHIPYCVSKPHLERPRRELAAKRAILSEHIVSGWHPVPCLTLRALASVYSDHPDYRAGWKP